MKDLSIVIPAYNEEARLPRTLEVLQHMIANKELQWSVLEVLVVNDGSVDGTSAFVKECAQTFPLLKLIDLPVNQGKGAAVRAGLKAALAEWVLIADADMATPWDEVNKFVFPSETYQLVMGSRGLPQSQITVRQHWIRQSMGKTFNKILKSLVALPFHDTQCGFKLVRKDEAFKKDILPVLHVDRFAWDVELILQMQKHKKSILEVPIRWAHQEASRVRMFRDSLEMFFTVWKLRFRLK